MVWLFNIVIHFCELHHNRDGTTNIGRRFAGKTVATNFKSCFHNSLSHGNDDQRSVAKFFFSKLSKFFSEIFKNFSEFPLTKFLVMALGFYCGSDAYLRSGWNVLDFSLVVCSIVDTLFVLVSKSSPKILGILRVFRLLRTLRPLRVISRAPGLKLVVQEIVANIGSINYSLIRWTCIFNKMTDPYFIAEANW